MKLNLIYSESIDNIIGVNNNLFCKLKSDLKMFQQITTTQINGLKNVVIMGFNTWLSIGKPLENRINVVITQNNKDKVNKSEDVMVFETLEECFKTFEDLENFNFFIIGGAKLYSYVMKEYYDSINIIYQTKINYEINQWIADNKSPDQRIIYPCTNSGYGVGQDGRAPTCRSLQSDQQTVRAYSMPHLPLPNSATSLLFLKKCSVKVRH